MKILFVCMYNRFRSKVAEAMFKNLNKDKSILSESAGMKLDRLRPYIEPVVLEYVNRKGYLMRNSKPKKITKKFLKDKNFDLIVITANNVDKKFFENFKLRAKIIKLQIKDCPSVNFSCIKNSINLIEKKVKALLKELKK